MIAYCLSVLLASAAFIAFYYLVLSSTALHQFKRWYLLVTMAASFLLPLVTITTGVQSAPVELQEEFYYQVFSFSVQDVIENAVPVDAPATNATSSFNDVILIICLHAMVSLVMLIRVLRRNIVLWNLVRQCQPMEYGGTVLHIIPQSDILFSYYNRICIGDKLLPQLPGLKDAIAHEAVHVKQKHTIDIWFAAVLQALAWPNLLLIFFIRAIRLNHEYLADKNVINKQDDSCHYKELLLRFATTSSFYPSSQLNGSDYKFLKNRFMMMNRKTSRFNAALIALFTILVGITVASFTVDRVPAKVSISMLSVDNISDTPAYIVPQMQPRRTALKDTSERVRKYLALESKCIQHIIRNGDTLFLFITDYKTRIEATRLVDGMTKEEKRFCYSPFSMFITTFRRTPNPPTKEQFERFKNASLYGVWIDNVKVSNDKLDSYSYTDFKNVYISKLYGAAKKGKTYTHQVDLETPAHFKKANTDDGKIHVSSMIRFTKSKKSSFKKEDIERISDSVRTSMQ